MPFRFAYSTNAYTRWPLERAVEDIKSRGFEGVELLADTPHAFPSNGLDAAALRDKIRAAELAVSNLNANTSSGLDQEGRDPSGFWPSLIDPDASLRRMKIDYVKRVIDLARGVGADRICTASGASPKEASKSAAFSFMAASLEAILTHAERAPAIKIGIEYEPGFLLGDMASTRRMLDEMDHPLLGVNLDLGHAWCVGEKPEDVIAQLGSRIWNVHVEDIKGRVHEHLIPGRGDIDFRKVFRALDRIRYDRFLTLELYPYKEDPGGAGEEGLTYLKSLLL
ncbi:MAG: sugar phosphate isomerase/epimerase [Planctomycetes bacterium]|nr:sugar phosphate isomerase/epimerase [Planctomycetota bacterium]